MTAVLDPMLVLALFFFLFLPITDRRTVMLKLAMITVIAALFAGSAAMTCGPSPPSQTVAMSGN
jgi:hypothetical protein